LESPAPPAILSSPQPLAFHPRPALSNWAILDLAEWKVSATMWTWLFQISSPYPFFGTVADVLFCPQGRQPCHGIERKCLNAMRGGRFLNVAADRLWGKIKNANGPRGPLAFSFGSPDKAHEQEGECARAGAGSWG
jgi:hypothetical protein